MEEDSEEELNHQTPNQAEKHKTVESPNTKPPPIYLHGKMNYPKLLETLKTKYNNNFHAKYSAHKLKVMFLNTADFLNFKELCRNSNIQFHAYALPADKVLTGLSPQRSYKTTKKDHHQQLEDTRVKPNKLLRITHSYTLSDIQDYIRFRHNPRQGKSRQVY